MTSPILQNVFNLRRNVVMDWSKIIRNRISTNSKECPYPVPEQDLLIICITKRTAV